MNYRLTVHLEEVKPVRQSTGKKIKNAKGKFESVSKVKLFNTLSFFSIHYHFSQYIFI